jgi:hypothetical protein
MPYKTWAPFERLLSDDMNTYLSEQVAAIFASAAARDTAIPAPVTGQPAYLLDRKLMTVYDGAAWRAIAGMTAGAVIEGTSTQSLTSGTLTTINLPVVIEDTGGFAGTPNTLTIPSWAAGQYLLLGYLRHAGVASPAGYRLGFIRKNGVDLISEFRAPPNTYPTIHSIVTVRRLAAGDLLTLLGQHTQGAALNSEYVAGQYPRLECWRLGD